DRTGSPWPFPQGRSRNSKKSPLIVAETRAIRYTVDRDIAFAVPLLMTWTQNYDPFASPLLSTLVAALPVVLLLGLLASGRVSAHMAALFGLLTAVLAAIFAFTPVEAETAGRAAWAGTVLAATAQ